MKTSFLLCCLIAAGSLLNAQQGDIFLSRYLPGGPELNGTEVSIFNASDRAADLSGYILSSRYWVLEMPAGVRVPGLSSLTFSSDPENGTLHLAGFPQFRKIMDESPEQGDFIALIRGSSGSLIDGLYLSDRAVVGFLPTTQTLPNGNQVVVPRESHPRWAPLQVIPDPVMAYDRNEGVWGANTREGNLFPATRYLFLQGRPTESGAVLIKWKTEFETNCLFHRIERSEDNVSFNEIGRWPGFLNSNELRDYQFLDTTVALNRSYFYRIRHIDRAGKPVTSETIPVKTSKASGFNFSVLKEGSNDVQYLRIRYSSPKAQKVNLKLLDERLRQIEVLSTGSIEPDREYLVTYRKTLAQGVYYLMVETEDGRYHEVVVIQ